MPRFTTALRHGWNAFTSQYKDNYQYVQDYSNLGPAYNFKPDRVRLRIPNGRTIVSSIYTRLAIDVASVDLKHVRIDDQGRYSDDIQSGLNDCLTLQANIDQAATQFRIDLAMTLFDYGVACLVPVDTSINPDSTVGGFDIDTMRVGEIVNWYPNHVRVSVYNEKIGYRQELTLKKTSVAIIENPLYSVMNEPNSTLQRLLTKLAQLDAVDEQSAAGKLDLIIQLPYVIKSEARRAQAEKRREDIEFQLKGSKYGIAYTDGTERITQLSRPIENNLMDQVNYLQDLLYSQLGMSKEIFDGTANDAQILLYWNRAINPIMTAIAEELKRKFLTKTARSQKQSIMYFKDPFSLVPVAQIADIADKFSRNEIMSSNEVRQVIGMKPSQDPQADQLNNANMPPTGVPPAMAPGAEGTPVPGEPDTGAPPTDDTATADTEPPTDPSADANMSDMTSSFDDMESQIDDALKSLG